MRVILGHNVVEYQRVGKGPVLVLLHGWANDHTSFGSLVKNLSEHYTCIVPDLPGFGASEIGDEAWAVDDYAQWLKAFCVKLKLTPQALIGHSLGGRIIIKAVSKGYVKPAAAVLIASAGVREVTSSRLRAYAAVAKVGKTALSLPGLGGLRARLRRMLYESAGSTDYLEAGAMAETFKRVLNEDLRADAARIKLPTLLIYGDADAETPLRYGQQLQGAIHDSQLVQLFGVGHFPHQAETAAVASSITQFLGHLK